MALTFFNVKTKERRTAKTEPQIAALLNSSDRNPNAMQGQDFGWRLAPETVVELRRIASNPAEMQTVAVTFGIPLENVKESDILTYIARQNREDQTGATLKEEDFTREYENDIRRLEDEQRRRDELIAKEQERNGVKKNVRPIVSDEGDGLGDIEELNEPVSTTSTADGANIKKEEDAKATDSGKVNKKKES